MRIVLSSVAYLPLTHGGIGVYTGHLARALAALGHTVHVVTCGPCLSRRVSASCFVHYVPRPQLAAFGTSILGDAFTWAIAVHRAVEIIDRRWGVDVVESPNSPPEGIVAAAFGARPVMARVTSPAAVWQKNDGWKIEGDRLTLCAAEDKLLASARGVMPVSRDVFEKVRHAVGERTPHRVIHLGLPADYGELSAAPSAREEFRVLALSRLQPTKGARALLAAIPRVLARHPKARFDLVARDVAPWTFRADFERAHPELFARVAFHSHVSEEEKKALLRRCHVMVAPSLNESFGLMYVEAMAFARAVIACPVGGVPEIVANGETGVLVRPDDEEALAEAILALAADPPRCDALGRAGYERFRNSFTAERMARETVEFYERVLSGGAG